MVHIVLSNSKGNQGLRYFPHTGYLGLTPVKVEGVVRTKLDDDGKPLQAHSITISVRCYESRIGRISILHSNLLVDYTQVLWSKPEGLDHAPITELEFPFRITIPPKVAGFSTSVFVDYRCRWRVEAVLNHTPIPHIGSRQIKHFELPLIRYDTPSPLPLPSPSTHILPELASKPRAPRIRYRIDPPVEPVGPLDIVSVLVSASPLDSSVTIRSASLTVERRISLNESKTPWLSSSPDSPRSKSSSSLPLPSPSTSSGPESRPPPTASSYQDLRSNGQSSTASIVSSDNTITPTSLYLQDSTADSDIFASDSRPLLPQHVDAPSNATNTEGRPKVIINTIACAESSGHFTRNDAGVWKKALTLQWPAVQPNGRWAIGETIQSELVSVKFFLRVKLVVSSPNGVDSFDLAEKELLIVSTNEAERQGALTKYNEALFATAAESQARSKSKSLRRTKREREPIPPSPGLAPLPATSSSTSSASSSSRSPSHIFKSSTISNSQNSSSKPATPRRPHTSAGPRDKVFSFAGVMRMDSVGSGRGREVLETTSVDASSRKRRAEVRSRPDTSSSSKSAKLFSSSPRLSLSPSASSGNSTTRSFSSLSSSSQDSDDVKAWEEELARIEVRSRRSSDMLGFSGKRKRLTGVPVAVVTANGSGG